MVAGSNAPGERGLHNLRRSRRRALRRRAKKEVYATPEGRRGYRVHMLLVIAGGVLGFAYLAAGPGFDDVTEVVGIVILSTMAGNLIGMGSHWRISSPLIRRRFQELVEEELRVPPTE